MKKKILIVCGVVLLFFQGALFAGDIVIYGDSQHTGKAQKQVVKAILQFEPSIVFRVGDIVEDGRDPGKWRVFDEIASPLLKTTEYFPALGNHELDSELYFKNFPIIENQHWYSLDRQGIHFILLDSNSQLQEGSEQYLWLESDLKAVSDDVKFKIAILHHPIFNLGPHGQDEQGLGPVLLPLFEKYGVCAVFSGHDHNYQRFKYRGIDFVVTGGGGSQLKDRTRKSPYLVKYKKAYHFCLLLPQDDSLSVRVIDTNLKVIDEFTIPAKVVSEAVQN